ncbi:hypothetical protein [Saccharopolyspora shandongensis]|uniref:hypothetical protein n=1 Tax=Saccharopolyspora shandongensis TaxID=418495 RepID=UPI00340C7F93
MTTAQRPLVLRIQRLERFLEDLLERPRIEAVQQVGIRSPQRLRDHPAHIRAVHRGRQRIEVGLTGHRLRFHRVDIADVRIAQ